MTAPLDPVPRPTGALALDTYDLTKRFGAFTALDHVSLKVRPGTVHALLGENGAGKSTLVKCVVGYQRAEEGAVLLDNKEHDIATPVVARDLGIGMVYQHFTVVPGMTVAENLLLARGHLPAVIDWKKERAALAEFMKTTPFKLDLDATPQELSAGQKQKLEILKQLLLKPRLLILDEPTSVLTPQEADEVLGLLRDRAHAGECSIVLITHKFREVTAYADDVSVLRKGKLVAAHRVDETTPQQLAAEMVGGEGDAKREFAAPQRAERERGEAMLQVKSLVVDGDRGQVAVAGLSVNVHAGEIVGIAGVSGNGQREFAEALVGQRRRVSGEVWVGTERFAATRAQNRRLKVRSLPEEPLRNACVGDMSVSDNIGLRSFDVAPASRLGWMRGRTLRERARKLIGEFGVKTRGELAQIRSLSGGNVQRAVLARELSDDAEVLIVSNPVFGLDFAAVAEIHQRLMDVRNRGGAVLLISEDLDELLALSDRIAVMSGGQVVHETDAHQADRNRLGAFMGGSAH
ncbi:ABC transporter ATP-binding protein [Piscinibacter gummiphilus]|uniref:ABC transporter ATP-binding protein n=1 Tax=Piscinibacter gummiphilus TaxID=946333 RepID=A0ABZ0CWJ4_9BURK|nr:ABC transporter ATP-binding protein [Piscinibacter gummiphilus]WOB09352.1 ABC transporter ATP-binding protein [Piscinibacter gummiphilus]